MYLETFTNILVFKKNNISSFTKFEKNFFNNLYIILLQDFL
jgi:hypothetical protein